MGPANSNNRFGAAKGFFGLFAGLLLLCAGPAAIASQSLREIRAQQAEEDALAREAAYTQQLCGVNFSVSIDWPSFSGWPEGSGVARACDRGLSQIETRCRKGESPKITRFVCTGDGSGVSERGGAVTYGASAR